MKMRYITEPEVVGDIRDGSLGIRPWLVTQINNAGHPQRIWLTSKGQYGQ